MNIRMIVVGLSLVAASGLSQADEPYYYGPTYYRPSYGQGAFQGSHYYAPVQHAVPSVKIEKSSNQNEYWDGPFYEQGSSNPYWVKRIRTQPAPTQGYVENPGRKYVERYAPHAAHHVPQYVPAETKPQSFTQDGKTYVLRDGVYYETAKPQPQPAPVPTQTFVPQQGQRYYIEDGVQKPVIPGTSNGVIYQSSDEANAAYGRSIGEYYRQRYGR